MALRSQRTKLVLKDLGEPAMVKNMTPEQVAASISESGVHRYVMGRLVGIARGFVERRSEKDGEIFEGLSGMFRVVPADPAREELESGVLFIPDAFHNMVADALRPLKAQDVNASVTFAFEISSIRAENPAGYSWDFKPLIENAAGNPLDGVFAALPSPEQLKQLTDESRAERQGSGRKSGRR
jgi:hypothetical protein